MQRSIRHNRRRGFSENYDVALNREIIPHINTELHVSELMTHGPISRAAAHIIVLQQQQQQYYRRRDGPTRGVGGIFTKSMFRSSDNKL